MKRLTMIILAILLSPMTTNAATVTFNRVTTYTDGTNIAPAKVPTIIYTGWYGATATGPWVKAGSVTDNLAITAPDPVAGSTAYYAVDASLDGMTSAKGAPASKTVAPLTPSAPGCTVR